MLLNICFKTRIPTLAACLLGIMTCPPLPLAAQEYNRIVTDRDLKVGAERMENYLPLIKGKKIALVANQTSRVRQVHLLDTLLASGVNVVKVLSPEHGFRGNAGDGEKVDNSRDNKTGVSVVSLYGKNLRPGKEALKGIDCVVFDIQDVGVRFYTFASTMQYVMDACAVHEIPMILLDRPNPNGFYIDGPVLEERFSSFVGLNPVPLVHGLTLGEYAEMINGEGWLTKDRQCDLTVISIYNYNHSMLYQLPVPPSPNLPNMAAVYLYPSLGLFEGTSVSVGRGTSKAFQIFGHPEIDHSNISFTPTSMPGYSLDPPYLNQKCYGYDVKDFGETYLRDSKKIYLYWLLETYKVLKDKTIFFNAYFDKLSGTDKLRLQIIEGKNEEQIRESWQEKIKDYKKIRKKYLLYPDFE